MLHNQVPTAPSVVCCRVYQSTQGQRTFYLLLVVFSELHNNVSLVRLSQTHTHNRPTRVSSIRLTSQLWCWKSASLGTGRLLLKGGYKRKWGNELNTANTIARVCLPACVFLLSAGQHRFLLLPPPCLRADQSEVGKCFNKQKHLQCSVIES